MTGEGNGVLLAVRDLRVDFVVEGAVVPAVRGVSLEVRRGEVLALVGESGSGKSVTAMSVLGLLPRTARVRGAIHYDGTDLLALDEPALRRYRGSRVAMVFQDPVAALNPTFTIGFQLTEAVRRHAPGLDRAAVRARVLDLLASVEIPEPSRRSRQYPHQLSGGQCQRVVIALGLAGDPELLIADEPTTALDVTVQAEVLELLRRLRERLGMTVLVITHDMGVVADIADAVVVLRDGEVVEEGPTRRVFTSPRAPYTQQLLAAVPKLGDRGDSGGTAPVAEPVLSVRDLVVEYGSPLRGLFRAVDAVDLTVGPGEIVGVVGESGSGKTTIGRAVIGLAPITSGEVRVVGSDPTTSSRRERQALRRRVGVVFQNPATSLNPRYTVGETVEEPLQVHLGLRGQALRERADAVLDAVGLDGRWRERYPHELSGGQRQRVAIGRAVALDPALLIADEPTSALDVSVQARVLDVFRELQARLGFGCLFISHDLAVVDSLCDRVVVLQRGRVVESGHRSAVLRDPQQDYTRRLIASAPYPDPDVQAERRRRAAMA